VAERKRIESQIAKSLSLQQATLESTYDGILVVDLNNTWVLYNQRFVYLWQIPDEIIASKNDSAALSYVLNQLEDAEDFVKKVRELYATPEANSYDIIKFKNGKIIERYSKPQFIDGKVVGRVWSFHDATERKKAENALHMEIAKRIEAERSLTDSMRQLSEKELAKTRFLAAAGHDLRQPLAAANLFIDALRFTETSPDQKQIIERLDQALSTFNGLLDALLNISKLDAGVIKPECSLIYVGEIFKWLDQSFAPIANDKQLGFKLFFPMKEALAINSDIGLINSVLMNLVSNAIKYTSKGAILVSARRRGNDVLFQVWDTGIGIKVEHIEHIFDEFYQINNPQRDRRRGLGLGLSIAQRAFALLGGKITCSSRIGCGSVFGFRLPLDVSPNEIAQQTVTVAPQEDVNPVEFVRGKHFVIVEDDALVAEAMCKALVMMGGEVKFFHRAEIALNYANIGHADFYIADYMLGGTLNGIQFLNKLRHKLGKSIIGVLVTGDTSPAFVRGMADCNWPVLHKPVNMSKLISRLSEQYSSSV
jgi:signal transduction histidine kinase